MTSGSGRTSAVFSIGVTASCTYSAITPELSEGCLGLHHTGSCPSVESVLVVLRQHARNQRCL